MNSGINKDGKKKRFYVTTPIYYPSAVPHIGTAYTTIAADVLARWKKLSGYEVYFLTGTDEHGQKMQEAAEKAGKTPKEFVDELVIKFKEAWELLNIKYDRFIRTTDKDHEETVRQIILRVHKAGDIYKGEYEGWYCTPCESYWTDLQLKDSKCPSCGRAVNKLKEEAYFFSLSKYQQKLLDFYAHNPEFLSPESRSPEILSRVRDGLKDLSITRTSFSWGIPFPLDEKHVTYVWFDALTNYLSGINFPHGENSRFWPCDVHIVGKEINWFHSVIWPAMLMSAEIPLPKKIYAHGWLTVNGEKMSKSLGNFLEPKYLVDKYGVDALRYHLLREIPFGDDGDFSEKAISGRINAELADDLGNLMQRTNVMIQKYFESKIPPMHSEHRGPHERHLIMESEIFEQVNAYIDKLQFNKAIEMIWGFIKYVNKYISETKPWEAAKKDPARLEIILAHLAEAIRLIALYIEAIMPATAENIRTQFNYSPEDFTKLKFGTSENTAYGHEIGKPSIIFTKIDIKENDDPFLKVNLKVAKILEVTDHPSADKLYVLQLDLGKEKRQLVAGIKAFYSREELVGKKICVVSNLKKAKLRGVESQGMLLAAEKDGVVKVLELRLSSPGEQVYADSLDKHKIVNNPITIEEFSKFELSTKNKVPIYRDHVLKTDRETVFVDIADDAKIR